MSSKHIPEGYFQIDHRAGDGISQEDAIGTGAIPVAGGKQFESATRICSNCQRLIVLHHNRRRERGYCRKCDAYHCDECMLVQKLSGGECKTFTKVMDEYLEAAIKGR